VTTLREILSTIPEIALRRVPWGEHNRVMDGYEPILSFGEDTAEIDDKVNCGDEVAPVAFLERLAGGGPAL